MFKPINLKNLRPRPPVGSKTGYLITRIIVTNAISVFIVIFTYLWIVYLLSNANSFWAIFRGKDVYENKDMVAPITPYLNPIPEATKDDTISVSGKAESGVKIVLTVDGQKSQETTTDAEGEFSFTNIQVSFSSSQISVTAIDQAGNTSKDSVHYNIKKDITEPEFTITAPSNDNEDYTSTGRTYKIMGTTEPGVSITVNEQRAMVNTNGEFSVNIRLEEGGNKLRFLAIDQAGNEKEEFRTLNYIKIE